jgi:hypothetical protein
VESLIEALVWRLTWALVRLLSLPLLIIGVVYYVVVPALITIAQLVFSPAGALAALLLLIWLWRR